MVPNPPPPPGAEPTSQKPPATPAVAAGSFWSSPSAWYERHKNKKSIFQKDYWKTTVGITVSYVASLTTKITLGWEHKTVIGGSHTVVMPFDNKINVGFVLNYIRPVKMEETRGNKSEWILGMKISHVKGKKNKFEGSNKTKVSEIESAQKTNKLNEHIATVEKIMTTLIKEEIASLEEEHDKVEASIKNYDQEYSKMEREIDKWTEKGNAFKADFQQYREECDNVAEKYSGKFKSLAAAAHEINASGRVEQTVSGQAKFIAGSMVKIGAAIIKAG